MDSSKPFLTTPLAVLIGAAVISIAILLSGGIIKVGKQGTKTPSAIAQVSPAPALPQQAPVVSLDTVKLLFDKKNIVFGDKNNKNLLVEVADPSCPYCHIAAGLNPQLNKEVGARFTLTSDGGTYVAPVPEMKKLIDQGKAAFVWIYSPGHGNGEMGTKAMYCAYEKGKFWEVHDKLMSNAGYDLLNNVVKNDKNKSKELSDFLVSVFDANQMKQCLDSGKYDSKLAEDTASATSIGINGTPGFYINTTSFAGAYSWKDMESALQ